jgi:hypothetical protein
MERNEMTDQIKAEEFEVDDDVAGRVALALLTALRDNPEVLASFGPKEQVNAKEPRSYVTIEGPEELVLSLYESL